MSNNGEFNNLPSMHYERSGCAAAALGGKVFVLGGWKQASGEMYDKTTQQWTTTGSMNTARYRGAAVSYGDSIIVMGGHDGKGPFSSVEQYSTITRQWSSFPSMNSKRWGCAAAVVEGKIFVIGGYDGTSDLSCGEEYDPTTQKWIRISPMHIRRSGCAAAVMGGQLYVIGGYGGEAKNDNYFLSSAEVYNPTTKQWTLIADMSTARDGCAAASLGGKIVVVGGWDGRGNLSSCEAYDTTTRRWSSIASMYTKRAYCAAVEVEGTLYVMGGTDGSNKLCSIESKEESPQSNQNAAKADTPQDTQI